MTHDSPTEASFSSGALMPADWVLVTGASTGLGLAIARQLIAADRRVILTARAQSLGRFAEQGHTDAGLACLADPDAPYHQHYANMAGFIGQVMKRVPATPETVARKVVRVLDARRPALRVPATLDAWAFSWMRRVLPRQLYHRLLYASLPNVRRWGPRSAGRSDPR
jgi:short-subunit dehydrogenase